MSDKKRPRACDTCHSIKIKCELGSVGGEPPCSRCQRLGKECLVSPPKRQKDRVAELEAQVEALTKLLQSQNIQPDIQPQTTPSDSSNPTPQSYGQSTARSRAGTGSAPFTTQKKRRLEDDLTPPQSESGGSVEVGRRFELDPVLTRDVQEELLARFLNELVPYFPVVPIAGDQSYEGLRRDRPILLQSAIYCASFGALSLDKQEDVGMIVMDQFAEKAMAEGEKSADLIQAIQAAVLYYRTTKHHTHIAAWQFIQLAGGLAEDIGIGGPTRPPSLHAPTGGPYVDSSEAWRTWLVCHMLSATLALFQRKPNASTWDERDENNLQMLEFSYFRMDTDEHLCQHVKAERLCDQIATQQCLYDNLPTVDVADPAVQVAMQSLQNSLTDWRAQIPPPINGPVMEFWELAATLYLHEPILHTPTNKSSFAAPFIAPRISITDFPCPLVTQEHVASIYKIKTTAHAIIDVFTSFDTAQLVALPAMYFPGRVAYATYVLAKLYIALTAPGNTYGAFMDPLSLQLEQYLDKMTLAYNHITAVDEFCGQARILSSAFRLKEWYLNYQTVYLQQHSSEQQAGGDVQVSVFPELPMTSAAAGDWSHVGFMDNTQDLGLEAFFTDPHLTDWFPQQLDNTNPTTNPTVNPTATPSALHRRYLGDLDLVQDTRST